MLVILTARGFRVPRFGGTTGRCCIVRVSRARAGQRRWRRVGGWRREPEVGNGSREGRSRVELGGDRNIGGLVSTVAGVVRPFWVLFLIQLLPQIAHAQETPLALVTAVQSFTETSGIPFRHALIDLNGDGLLDAIVLLRSREWCGSVGAPCWCFEGW